MDSLIWIDGLIGMTNGYDINLFEDFKIKLEFFAYYHKLTSKNFDFIKIYNYLIN